MKWHFQYFLRFHNRFSDNDSMSKIPFNYAAEIVTYVEFKRTVV